MAEKSEKTTKQDLTAQDAFQLYGAEASDWLMKRQQLIGGALGVLLLGGLIGATWHYFATRGEDKASKQLGQALTVLERPVVTGVDLQPAAPDQEPPFKSEKEKDEAVVKALGDFRAAHSGSDAAVMAALPLAKAEYRLGNYEGALAGFAEFIDKGRKEDPLMVAAREGQGYAHEAKAQLDQALVSFQEMAKLDGGGFLQGMGQYHQARILVAQGKKDEAAQLLADLKSSQTNTAAGRLATERLAVLAAEGVKIPEPKAAPAAATPAATNTDAK